MQFRDAWSLALDKSRENADEIDTPEEDCRLASDCVFVSALNAAKVGISDDVVRLSVILKKIIYAATFETGYAENLPSSCDFLFGPNVPKPPYQTQPYPYESYPYEYYQLEPYQRNPYQRNSYNRNPYQRSPYQRKPYQRKAYLRNPYKRRN